MFTLHTGDCIDVLKTLPDSSVDSVVTSPPYAMQRASTYGGVPEKDYPEWTVAWMREVWRVLKDDGSVLLNISPHRSGGSLSDYVLQTRLALRADGWIEPDEIIWHKPNAMPGGPSNRPRRTWEHIFWFAKNPHAWSDPYVAGEPHKEAKRGRAAFSTNNTAARNGWGHKHNAGKAPLREIARVTNVATFAKAGKTGYDHPAPFPWQLAEWCGKLITPPGGTILDPFTGSSSTGVAAIRNGWNFIGIDQSQEYIDMSRKRLDAEKERLNAQATHASVE